MRLRRLGWLMDEKKGGNLKSTHRMKKRRECTLLSTSRNDRGFVSAATAFAEFTRLGGFVAESVSVTVGVSVNVSVCVYVSVIHLPLRRFLDRAKSKARAGTRARVIPSARKNQRQSQGQKHQRT